MSKTKREPRFSSFTLGRYNAKIERIKHDPRTYRVTVYLEGKLIHEHDVIAPYKEASAYSSNFIKDHKSEV